MAHLRAGRRASDGPAVFPLLSATALLDLLQLSDSSFPSGSYAHSFGLEWLLGQGEVDLEMLLRARLMDGLARLELPVLRAAFGAPDVDALLRIDRLMDVLLPVNELRSASRSIGRSFLRAAAKISDGGLCRGAEQAGLSHQVVVFGMVARVWGVSLDDALQAHVFQSPRQQLSAAQRMGRIGQSAVQAMLHRLKPAMLEAVRRSADVPLEEAGSCSPWLDLAGMQHERQLARLFLS